MGDIRDKLTKSVCVLFVPILLGACISTQEMPLAPNVVRIDTQSRGLLYTGQTVPQTMRAAANATLARGYTHFKFADASLGQGSQVTGVVGSTTTTASATYGYGSASGIATTSGGGTLVRAPTASAAATVIMFRENDPKAADAFDAQQVLQQYPK